MKKLFIVSCFCICILPSQAQLFKKLKDKVNKTVDKAVGNDKPQTETEKKEDAASSEYSDDTENNEKPIFVDVAPANGKMILKLKKGDRFWGGYITIKGQPKKSAANANVLDSITARVGSFYTDGEISNYAIYFNGQRFLNDSSIIPLRPTFISYDINKTPFFSSTEGKAGTPDPTAAMAAVKAKGNNVTKEDEAEFAKTAFGQITQPTFSFRHNGKTYGPFEGIAEKMLVLKSMTDGKPTPKFYGLGSESYIGKEGLGYNALVQTEKGIVRLKDCGLTALTYPNGLMAMSQGKDINIFSNGKTVPVIKIAGIETSIYNTKAGNKFIAQTYGTDSGRVVCILTQKDNTGLTYKNGVEVMIDYKTMLIYSVEITQKNLLVSRNPAKSVLYKAHTLYYADGTKETIDNVGDAQLVGFNGKEYIVWFAMKKVAEGHEIYVCQKELK